VYGEVPPVTVRSIDPFSNPQAEALVITALAEGLGFTVTFTEALAVQLF